MNALEWSSIRYFKSAEFDSHDAPGTGSLMQVDFIRKLDLIRAKCGFPFTVMSGYRTEAHNAEVGGKDSSAHTKGWAADIACRTSSQRCAILSAALSLGIHRIGIADAFIHLDMDPDLPPRVIWTY